MRTFLAACLTAVLLGGCAQTGQLVRPADGPQNEPQFHNRLRISENNDIVGV